MEARRPRWLRKVLRARLTSLLLVSKAPLGLLHGGGPVVIVRSRVRLFGRPSRSVHSISSVFKLTHYYTVDRATERDIKG